jgi:predicted HicB family RNase H-like nuclease
MDKSEYTARLVTRIRPVTSRRLRLAAAVKGLAIGQFVDGVLDEHLPSADDLADRIRRGDDADDQV